MKKIIAILVFCQTLYMNAQTNYDRGYQRGWKEGYCQNYDGVSCLPPNPPMTPMSRINENDNSYKDGYNRGFTDGLAAYRGGNSRSNRQGRTFKTSDLEVFNDFYRAPWQEINNVLREKQAKFDRLKSELEDIDNWLNQIEVGPGKTDQENLKIFRKFYLDYRDNIYNFLMETGDVDTARPYYTKLIKEIRNNEDMRHIERSWKHIKDAISHNNELKQIYSECNGDSRCAMRHFLKL